MAALPTYVSYNIKAPAGSSHLEVPMNDVTRVQVLGDLEQLIHDVLLVDGLQDARLCG